MEQSVLFKAYLDKPNIITIQYQGNCDSFYVNNLLCNTKLISSIQKIKTYQIETEVDLTKNYVIKDVHFNETILQKRFIVKTQEFDDLFYYDKNDLGPSYTTSETTFKIWAPISEEAYVKYIIDNQTFIDKMDKSEKGTFAVTIKKDLWNASYIYLLKTNGEYIEVNDPYAYSCTANSQYSAVIDLKRTNIDLFEKGLPKVNSNADAIIYEVNVRDFSSDNSLGKEVNNLFKAFCKENIKSKNNNPIGIDYLKFLGFTHVQLMPVTDFVTVDETNVKSLYNWGYDPAMINCIEGSYCSNPDDPYSRIIECKEMIQSFHKNKIRVVFDMVFNHYYYTKENILNKIVPYYFFQCDSKGNFSNGTFCGNDFDTTRKMAKKYIIDISKRYVEEYKIDGFRLDLMGILDKDTVNLLYNECRKINDSFILYGEGWNMPSLLNQQKRASLNNCKHMPNIGFFNDFFRDVTKGKNSDNELAECGYLNGKFDLSYEMKKAMKGSIESNYNFVNAAQSINYIECHDNATLHDKLAICNDYLDDTTKNNITLCALACVIFSLGTPFLHMGTEFHRTKNGKTNTYNSNDKINSIKWDLIDKYFENVLTLRSFIKLRKKYNIFKIIDINEINKHFNYQILDNNILKIYYKNLNEIDGIDEIAMFINPTSNISHYNFYEYFKFVCSEHGKIKDDVYCSNIIINPYSFSMYIKEIKKEN